MAPSFVRPMLGSPVRYGDVAMQGMPVGPVQLAAPGPCTTAGRSGEQPGGTLPWPSRVVAASMVWPEADLLDVPGPERQPAATTARQAASTSGRITGRACAGLK